MKCLFCKTDSPSVVQEGSFYCTTVFIPPLCSNPPLPCRLSEMCLLFSDLSHLLDISPLSSTVACILLLVTFSKKNERGRKKKPLKSISHPILNYLCPPPIFWTLSTIRIKPLKLTLASSQLKSTDGLKVFSSDPMRRSALEKWAYCSFDRSVNSDVIVPDEIKA